MTLAELNSLPPAEAEVALLQCCGSRRWVERILAERPFASTDDLLQAADRSARELTESDWLETFAAHPRIGERGPSAWSQAEQAAALNARQDIRARLHSANAEYESKFGFTFIVYASDKRPEQILDIMSTRMHNPREVEIREAAAEQQSIARARLRKLVEI